MYIKECLSDKAYYLDKPSQPNDGAVPKVLKVPIVLLLLVEQF